MRPQESEPEVLDFREVEVKSALACQGWSFLECIRLEDQQVGPFELTPFDAMLSTCTGTVWQAWVIRGGGMLNVLNREGFPNLEGAIAYHIGMLVRAGKANIILPVDEAATRPDTKPHCRQRAISAGANGDDR